MKAQMLSVALLLVAISGCGDTSEVSTASALTELTKHISSLDEKVSSLQQSLAERDAQAVASRDEAAEPSLAAAHERLDEQDFAGAYDYLLAAMRLNPSDPDVFNVAMDFVDAAAQVDEDESLELASDIYVRCDRLIPFLPVPQIASARQRWLEVEQVPQRSVPAAAPHPVDSLVVELEQAAAADLPAQNVSLALQHIRSELQSLAASAALDAQEESFWDRWKTADAALEQAETNVLVRLYHEKRPSFYEWLDQRAAVLKAYGESKTNLHVLGQQVAEVLQQGDRLRSELSSFAEADVAEAVSDMKQLDEHLDQLRRAQEWIYNQHALAMVDFLQKQSDVKPLEKLKRLARSNEYRLSPYVLQRFQEQWQLWFEELDSEEQRIEATKARVLQGVKL